MKREIFILGSTGSIGETTLNILRKYKNHFKIGLLTTNKNTKKIYKQALEFKVKNIVIFNKKAYSKSLEKFKKRQINVYFTIRDVFKTKKKDLT